MSFRTGFRARMVGMGNYKRQIFVRNADADAMMPRFSPPTAMGLPRNFRIGRLFDSGKKCVRIQMNDGPA